MKHNLVFVRNEEDIDKGFDKDRHIIKPILKKIKGVDNMLSSHMQEMDYGRDASDDLVK
jgi:hypothetical protein